MRRRDTGQPAVAQSLRSAPVAQLDRALAFEATGRGFESLRARHALSRRCLATLTI
jgi:hypothetical protein